jgi:hypothetical protein
MQRNAKHVCQYGAVFVRHEYLKFWSPREWKPTFDVANSLEIGTSSSCCCGEFYLCICRCFLSVANQDADVLQKFAHYLWVDRRFGPLQVCIVTVYVVFVGITITHGLLYGIGCGMVCFCMTLPPAVTFQHRCHEMFCRIHFCHFILTCQFRYCLAHCFVIM